MAPLLSPESPGSKSPSLKALETYTDENINVTWVPDSSYNDKFNIVMASGDLPQAIVIKDKSAGFIKSVKAGAFWELSPYLKDYKNLSQADEKIVNNSSVNGEVYGIYRSRDLIRACMIIRTDWLEKVGLDMPETLDDFYEVLKAFKEKDPDGNGKDDTYGMVVRNGSDSATEARGISSKFGSERQTATASRTESSSLTLQRRNTWTL